MWWGEKTLLTDLFCVLKVAVSSFIRMKAQTLVDSLSELMVDASLGTIQCLEEIVSNCYYSHMEVFVPVIKYNGI